LPEKVKIKLSELTDIYDIEQDTTKESKQEDSSTLKSEFEIYTENYDEKELKENES